MKFSFSKIHKKDNKIETDPEATLKDYSDIIRDMKPTHVYIDERLIWAHTADISKLYIVLEQLETFPVYKVTCIEEIGGLKNIYIDTKE